jgi:hypothetical protein
MGLQALCGQVVARGAAILVAGRDQPFVRLIFRLSVLASNQDRIQANA